MTEEEALAAPWTEAETRTLAVRPEFITNGRPNVTRRELRELAARYPKMLFPERPRLRGDSDDVLRARYPTMFKQ